jgi:diaminohydroxyphosphoribosylaminopyrimidine deaminase/5-amino-6-(5-phosphoribosylamino)uracil reductase
MAALAARGVTRVLAEGGPRLAASLLEADLIDEAVVFRAAVASHGATIRPFGAEGAAALTTRPSYSRYAEKPIGPDRVSVYRRSEFW